MPAKNYFKPLTGLRFIAALMVYLCHLAPRNFTPFINQLFTEMQAGVPIFFVLSGFLLGYRYFDKINIVQGGVFKYLWNRIVRIYPMYFIIVICNILWYKLDTTTALLNLTFFHGFFNEYVFKPLPHTWSLTVEVTFYLLLPFIFLLIVKGIGIIKQALFFIATGLLLTFLFVNLKLEGFWFNINYMMVLTFFGRCFEFLVGIQIALLLKNNSKLLFKSINYTYFGFLLVMLSIITLTFIGDVYSYSGIVVHNFILPLCIAILLTGLILEETFVSKVLSSKLFILLGNSSYVFFLIHYGFWPKLLFHFGLRSLALNLLLTTLVSIVLYLLIERTIEKKLKIRN